MEVVIIWKRPRIVNAKLKPVVALSGVSNRGGKATLKMIGTITATCNQGLATGVTVSGKR